MCGRYFFQLEEQETYFFKDQLIRQQLFDFRQGEVFPSQRALVLQQGIEEIQPAIMKWGIPSYRGNVLINARMEGIEEKMTFRPLLDKRCAIVANGFYEWYKHGTKKDKIYIQKQDTGVIYFAGLYNAQGEFVIVTATAKQEMARIHDRTPIIMNEPQMRLYLHKQRGFIVDNDQLLFHKE